MGAKSRSFWGRTRRRWTVEERIWVTKDGREIPYEKMDPGHLLNTLMWLRRRSMEKAQDAAHKDGVVLGPDGWLARKAPDFDGLLEEAKRRRGEVLEVAKLIASRGEIDEQSLKRRAAKLRQD